MISFEEAIDTYSSLRMGGYAPVTWKAHRNNLARLRQLVTYEVGQNIPLSAVDHCVMVRYMDRLRPPRHAASTFNNYRQYLVTFFDHCRGEGWLTENPMRHVRPAKVARRERLQLTPGEMQQIIDDADDPRDRTLWR